VQALLVGGLTTVDVLSGLEEDAGAVLNAWLAADIVVMPAASMSLYQQYARRTALIVVVDAMHPQVAAGETAESVLGQGEAASAAAALADFCDSLATPCVRVSAASEGGETPAARVAWIMAQAREQLAKVCAVKP
jgi:hypothetical protein